MLYGGESSAQSPVAFQGKGRERLTPAKPKDPARRPALFRKDRAPFEIGRHSRLDPKSTFAGCSAESGPPSIPGRVRKRHSVWPRRSLSGQPPPTKAARPPPTGDEPRAGG